MRTKPFTAIRSSSKKLTRSLHEKYPHILNGLAISILSGKNFRQSLEKQEDIKQMHFTKDELYYCKNRVTSLAGRFAAKMAINEALQKQIPLKDINISSAQTGEPIISFSGKINPLVSVSISHEEDLVTAVAGWASKGKTIAVGIDAASISRFYALITQTKIMQKILTARELYEINNHPVNMAKKWSGKEAVSKAIGIGIWHGGSLREIEILTDKKKPFVKLHGKVLEQAKTKGLHTWMLDYIYDKNFVLASVFATD